MSGPVVAEGLRDALQGCVTLLEKMDTIRHIAPEFEVLDKARTALAAHPVAGSPAEATPACKKCDDEGMVWVDGCTTPCLACQDVTDDSAAEPMPAEADDECDECGGVLKVVSTFRHKDWCSLAAEPMPASEAPIKYGNSDIPDGYFDDLKTAPVPASEAAKNPALYMRQIDIDNPPQGRSIIASQSCEGEWSVPLYFAAPAAPTDAKPWPDLIRAALKSAEQGMGSYGRKYDGAKLADALQSALDDAPPAAQSVRDAAQPIAALIEAGALRQYRHNDGSDGFVFAYDKEITDRVLAAQPTNEEGSDQ